jgi:DNA-binding response OmpR family regulator
MKTVLVVDDEQQIAEIARDYLRHAGFAVITAAAGAAALAMARAERPDLIVLDLALPRVDGFDVARTLRRDSNVPIIMLTARVEEADRLRGLEIGADDYITKPFSLREVEARIKSVLRRARAAAANVDGKDETPIVCGNLRVDPVRREVTIADRHVDLTPKEFDLLRLFASNPGRVFPRKYLLEKIWDYSYEGYDRTIDSHINRLRAKIEENPENPQLVLTVWGIGYKFTDAE